MSAVSFSFRVVRNDRREMHKREVYAVLSFFLDRRRVPDGYKIMAVNWRAPRRGRSDRRGSPGSEQEATDAMIEHFWNILKVKGLDALRAGTVKRDRL